MIRYFWSEANGGDRPSIKYMEIVEGVEYYVGMPLKKVDVNAVAPTDGDPEYICMGTYSTENEVRVLDIPCMEIFPDTIYERQNEDGSVEEVRFGGKGGGGCVSSWNDLTDKPFGETITELYRVENGAFPLFMGNMPMHMVPDSMVLIDGQTYTVVWDGIPYECVYTYIEDMGGQGLMGNMVVMGGEDTGEPFVYAFSPSAGMQGFADVTAIMSGNLTETTHSFSVTGLGVKKLDAQYFPPVAWNAASNEIPVKNQPCSIREKYEYIWDGDITGREKVEAYRNNNYVFYYVKMDEIELPYGYYNVKCITRNIDGDYDLGYDEPLRTGFSHGVSWGSNRTAVEMFVYNGGKGLPEFIRVGSDNIECSLGNGFTISRGVWFLYLEDLLGNKYQFTSNVEVFVFDNYLTSAYFRENSLELNRVLTDSLILQSSDHKKYFNITVDSNGNLTAVEV